MYDVCQSSGKLLIPYTSKMNVKTVKKPWTDQGNALDALSLLSLTVKTNSMKLIIASIVDNYIHFIHPNWF